MTIVISWNASLNMITLLKVFIFSGILLLVTALPNLPYHQFVKRVTDGQKSVEVEGKKEVKQCVKDFVTLCEGSRTFRKRRIFGKPENGSYRASFVCKGCERAGIFFKTCL